MAAAALLPVWLFPYFPTQDGPSHLYNAFVLAHYFDAGSVTIRSYFALNLRPFPNWTLYAVMAPLLRILPPLVVQQIVLSLCIAAIPIAALYLQKSFRSTAGPSVLIGVLLAYSYVFFMGFLNFVLGAALFAITVGFWWRRRSGRYLAPLYGLLIAVYFTHGLAFAATLMAIGVLAATERRWRVLVELVPAGILFLLDAAARANGAAAYQRFGWHLRRLGVLVVVGHPLFSAVVLLVLAAAVGVTLARRRANAMAIVSAVLLAGYFVAPWGYTAGGWIQAGWISERFFFLLLLTLPAWVEMPWPPWSAGFMAALVAGQLGVTDLTIARLNGEIGRIARHAAVIAPHSTVRTLFPASRMAPDVTPMLHLTGYLALRPDVVDLDDYEGLLPDFPLQYRAHLPVRPPDFIVAWRGAGPGEAPGYEIAAEDGPIRILRYHSAHRGGDR